jgi:type I restriction enzyme R subunit
MEQTFEGSIILKETDGEFEPIGMGSGKSTKDEDKDTLSQIINAINELYGGQITDEDRANLENMRRRMRENEELKSVMAGNNSETNKRHKFNEVMSSILLSYVNNRLDFYNKMDDPKIKNYIGDILFKDLVGKNRQVWNVRM